MIGGGMFVRHGGPVARLSGPQMTVLQGANFVVGATVLLAGATNVNGAILHRAYLWREPGAGAIASFRDTAGVPILFANNNGQTLVLPYPLFLEPGVGIVIEIAGPASGSNLAASVEVL